MPVDYDSVKSLLQETFTQAEAHLFAGSVPQVAAPFKTVCDEVFSSHTQAYREGLLGCVIARVQDKNINIRQPYVKQGPNAFNGRTLDEKVINPFLQEKRIPSTKGPYLSAFRRSVRFDISTREGLRDKSGYDSFLTAIAHLESISEDSQLHALLQYLLYKFAELREASTVALSPLQRISLEQYDQLISGLLAIPSGGRFPVLLVVTTFTTIKEFFNLNWTITWQGINVADAAAGAAGDISIVSGGQTLLAAEVTERPVDRSRVVSTFNTKIAPAGIEDYLFFVKTHEMSDDDARQQAERYFSQGHEVNFLEIKNWILVSLATVGKEGRALFNKALLDLLNRPDVPKALKVAWNEQMTRITG